MRSVTILSLLLVLGGVGGCVSKGRYDDALADAEKVRADLLAQRAESAKALAGSQAERDRLGQLLASKGALESSLDETRARLDELRRARAAAEARAAVFRDVALRLKRMVDAGTLQITLRSRRMVLALSTDIIFDSGKTQIKPQGKEALAEIGAVLGSIPDRFFQVAGHTDDEPIRVSPFYSNWQLSTERALAVVKFLTKNGMRPESLSAAGYSEYDPVKPNDTKDNKAANRRIEITLQPNIDELVSLPEER